jgi:hypothetical protein
VKARVAAIVDWWKMRKRFRGPGGKPHSLFFRGERATATLTIASTEQDYRSYIAEVKVADGDAKKVQARETAFAALSAIENLRVRNKDDGSKTEEFEKLLDQLSQATQVLMGGATEVPQSTPPIYGGQSSGGFATSMTINVLSDKGPVGTQAAEMSNPVWNVLKQRKERPTSARRFYKLGHLLSWHLHGPGNLWGNLTPQSESGNQTFERGEGERKVKRLVNDEKKAVLYTVNAVHGRSADKSGIIAQWEAAADPLLAQKRAILDAEDHVATSLQYRYKVIFEDGRSVEDGAEVTGPADNDIRQQADKYHI